MKCDLHVHTCHSGMCTIPVARKFCRECYTDPLALYGKLKTLGMALVTVTDHDSIDAAEALRSRPDFFLSEEVTCLMPSGAELHVGVYDINERQHVELQRRRRDLPSLLAYLGEQNLFFSANHIFSGLTGRRFLEDFECFGRHFPSFEILNGAVPRVCNRNAEWLAQWAGKAVIGGSDAHTLASAGSAWTEVRGARNVEEFLRGLRAGAAIVRGASGSYWKLTKDVLQIGVSMMTESRRWRILSPVLAFVPLVTLLNYWIELSFADRWLGRVADSRGLATELWSGENVRSEASA